MDWNTEIAELKRASGAAGSVVVGGGGGRFGWRLGVRHETRAAGGAPERQVQRTRPQKPPGWGSCRCSGYNERSSVDIPTGDREYAALRDIRCMLDKCLMTRGLRRVP